MKDSFKPRLLIYDVLTSNIKELCISEVQWFSIMSKVWSTQPCMIDFLIPACFFLPAAWGPSSKFFESPDYWKGQHTELAKFTVWFNITNHIPCNTEKLKSLTNIYAKAKGIYILW